ncbi:MAG: CsgG/HfaB family protein [Elusimicrobia bacterium]|nr:CsgG/HfaB family protein [Candidatus Liberimonas magnetica]
MLKKIFILAMVAGCLAVDSYSKDIPFEERTIAAVMPFSYHVDEYPQYEKSVSGIADALAVDLLKTNKVRLLERTRIDDVLKEVALGQSGVIDNAKAIQAGKQLGAQQVILGSIIALSIREEGRSVKIAEKTTRWVEIQAEVRLVDVETGELLATGKATNKVSSAEKHAFGGKIGKLATPESLVQQALEGLGEKLAKDLAKSIRPVTKKK